MRKQRDPRTKEDFLDRLLRYDFDGDIRNIGAEPARVERTAANTLRLTFPDTGTTYEISVHRPREEAPARPARQVQQPQRQAAPQRRQGEERQFSNDEDWTVEPTVSRGGTSGGRQRRRSRKPQEGPSPEQ